VNGIHAELVDILEGTVNLKINRDLVETLIGIYEDYIRSVYPYGTMGKFSYPEDSPKPPPNRTKFKQFVDSLDLDMRTELIALLWLGKNDEQSVEQFPGLLEQAVGVQDTAAEFLVGQTQLSRCLRKGMAKLGVI
jgi:hypothetical protein